MNYARCVNAPLAKNAHDEEISKRKREIELAELNVRKAEFDVQLKAMARALNPPKPKSVEERLTQKFGSKVELDNAVRLLEAMIDEKFKDDPVEREKQHAALLAAAQDTLT